MIQKIKVWLGTGSINIFGIQLSGKDTQGHKLANLLGGSFISSGEILRSNVVPASIKQALDKGLYPDSKDVMKIVLPYLSKPEFSGKPLILSSVGRRLSEEGPILDATEKSGHSLKCVLYLDIDEATALSRLQNLDRNRDDDYLENLKNRISEFKTKTLPVVEVYRQLGLVIDIDACPDPETVNQSVIHSLYKRAVRS